MHCISTAHALFHQLAPHYWAGAVADDATTGRPPPAPAVVPPADSAAAPIAWSLWAWRLSLDTRALVLGPGIARHGPAGWRRRAGGVRVFERRPDRPETGGCGHGGHCGSARGSRRTEKELLRGHQPDLGDVARCQSDPIDALGTRRDPQLVSPAQPIQKPHFLAAVIWSSNSTSELSRPTSKNWVSWASRTTVARCVWCDCSAAGGANLRGDASRRERRRPRVIEEGVNHWLYGEGPKGLGHARKDRERERRHEEGSKQTGWVRMDHNHVAGQ